MDYESSKNIAQLMKLIIIAFIIHWIFKPKDSEIDRKREVHDDESNKLSKPDIDKSVHLKILWEGNFDCVFTYKERARESSLYSICLLTVFEKSGVVHLHGLNINNGNTINFILDHVSGDISFSGFFVSKVGLLNYSREMTLKSSISRTKNKTPYIQTSTNNTVNKKTKPRVKIKSIVENLSYSSRNRKSAVAGNNDIDWRKEGLLSLSGYRVGKSRGVIEKERRMIIKSLYKDDDLLDVSDRVYAEEWGAENTSKRYKKIIDSLSTFLYQAEKRNRSPKVNLDIAISQ